MILTDLSHVNAGPLEALIIDLDIRSVIEIGSFIGCSAAFFAKHPQIESVICIDPFKVDPDHWWAKEVAAVGVPLDFYPLFEGNMKRLGLWDKFTIFRGKSADMADKVPSTDLVYIDGPHDYENCANDIKLYLPKARKAIAGDDYNAVNYPGVIRAASELVPGHSNNGHMFWKVL